MFGCRHSRGWDGEAHMDVEAAFGPGVRCERRAVYVGDGADDGEAQPIPVRMADSLGAEALERLEEPVNLAGRDQCSGVRDRDHRLSAGGCRGDLDAAAV